MLYLTLFAIIGTYICNESFGKKFFNFIEKFNKEGVASNTNSEVIEAVSYGLAKEMKVDDFYIENSKNYKPPQYVEKLPPKQPIASGEVVTIDEVNKILKNFKII